MSVRQTFTWLAIAPLGLGLTTGLTITTTLLTQQPIGLSSESLSAGDALAPRITTTATKGIRAHAPHSTPAPIAHGGRAESTAVPRTHPGTVTPRIATPSTPTPSTPTPSAPTPTTAQVKPPTTKPPAQTEDHGGRGQRRSGDGGGRDRKRGDDSGSRVRDD